MDPVQMEKRCPGALARGAALLRGHRLIFTWDSNRWRGGVGSIIGDGTADVWGVLWDISSAHERTLDRYELVHRGVYRKASITVEREAELVQALVYIATETEPKLPSARYLETLLRGARAYDLPASYVSDLAEVPSR